MTPDIFLTQKMSSVAPMTNIEYANRQPEGRRADSHNGAGASQHIVTPESRNNVPQFTATMPRNADNNERHCVRRERQRCEDPEATGPSLTLLPPLPLSEAHLVCKDCNILVSNLTSIKCFQNFPSSPPHTCSLKTRQCPCLYDFPTSYWAATAFHVVPQTLFCHQNAPSPAPTPRSRIRPGFSKREFIKGTLSPSTSAHFLLPV